MGLPTPRIAEDQQVLAAIEKFSVEQGLKLPLEILLQPGPIKDGEGLLSWQL